MNECINVSVLIHKFIYIYEMENSEYLFYLDQRWDGFFNQLQGKRDGTDTKSEFGDRCVETGAVPIILSCGINLSTVLTYNMTLNFVFNIRLYDVDISINMLICNKIIEIYYKQS